ncbi:MAG: bifunctional 4-hydroxy-2-oxoglutarate aldolase/2-dehydro-3-deoxy-phosphogluconate aldolase [Pseudomonadales bacterium]|nr:bifunctional 4-hydroxy-2-oxoglutarate aldolase/2-dehydro-3-deoxy-phosphogluconate aldolase [Pseudomonadales bacterium]MCP5184629.1 bifunctional 4-hydroxy-2-oxoglutarate aldolase/2-dehydro-3-deoxy-phosphogluconate aldolase [Pseudomonadales bacterium]
MDATALLGHIHLMPVVAIHDAAKAVPLAECLLEAGIAAIEITLRTEAALAAMERVARHVPGILVGAGSVRRPEQFTEIANAGARFAISPGSTDTLLAAANMPFIPGAATASECIRLLEHGYRMQKFFPAESLGGVKTIRALSAPLPEVRFCPTGGITEALAPDYLALDCVGCIGGSWFVSEALIDAGDFAQISQRAASAAALRQLSQGS